MLNKTKIALKFIVILLVITVISGKDLRSEMANEENFLENLEDIKIQVINTKNTDTHIPYMDDVLTTNKRTESKKMKTKGYEVTEDQTDSQKFPKQFLPAEKIIHTYTSTTQYSYNAVEEEFNNII